MGYIVRVRQEIYVPIYNVESNTEAITKAIAISDDFEGNWYGDVMDTIEDGDKVE